jgi:hypothetical protein
MVDFRKALLLLAVLAVTAGIASAQVNPLICVANAGVPPIVRSEGIAEEVGQVIIRCTGGASTAINTQVPTVNVQIFTSAPISSRLLSSSTLETEAMLLVDEPAVGTRTLATLPPAAVISADGIGDVTYTGGNANVFRSQASAANPYSITWLGVPFDPPGTAGERVLRLVNVRVNVAAITGGGDPGFIPQGMTMLISISGTGSLALSNPLQTVAIPQKGMEFSTTTANYLQCVPPTDDFTLTFKELFATAFRAQGGNSQSTLGTPYNTEGMFSDPAVLTNAGVATQGTRLMVKFVNIPANVTLAVNYQNNSFSSSNAIIGNGAQLVTGTDANGAGGTVTSGSGSVTITSAGSSTAMAVWEVISAEPGAIRAMDFDVDVSYGSNPLPALGSADVFGSYAPTSTVGSTIASAVTTPVPRFIAPSPDFKKTLSILSCQTNLLFPFVTNQGGFDTGMVISNTSEDPGWVAPQKGACKIYYYGTDPAGNKPATQTSGTVAEGKQLIWTLSLGGNLGVAATPGFQGYIIASCDFQYGHGYAFISDAGASKLAQGYLALILDGDMHGSTEGRTGKLTERLDN